MKRILNVARGASVLALAIVLAGCVVEPMRVRYAGEVVAVAPPAALVETLGAAPVPGSVWLGGYWNWRGGRHEWSPGYWGAPRAGFRWVPHAWARVSGGWRLREGYWASVRR